MRKVDALKVCLAAYEIRKARAITEPSEQRVKEKAALHRTAVSYLNAAKGSNPLVVLGKSLLMTSQGEYDVALSNAVQLSKTPNNVVALLARVSCQPLKTLFESLTMALRKGWSTLSQERVQGGSHGISNSSSYSAQNEETQPANRDRPLLLSAWSSRRSSARTDPGRGNGPFK